MKRTIIVGLTLAWLLVAVAESQAFGHWWRGSCAPYCPPPCAPVVTCCYKVEAIPVKCTVMVPKLIDVKRTINVCIPVPREIIRDVCCTKFIPVECVDCNGCKYTCLRPQTYTTQVKCTIMDCKYEPREVLCKSVIYVPAEVIRTYYRCVPVPCATPACVGTQLPNMPPPK